MQLVKAPAKLAGTSEAIIAKSGAPLRLKPAVTPAALKPGTEVTDPPSIQLNLLIRSLLHR